MAVRVRDALTRLGVTHPDADDDDLPRQVVEVVYADVDESLWGAAEWSVRAQLAYLAAAPPGAQDVGLPDHA